MYEESAIINPPTRTDIEILSVPANEEALKLNLKRAANMILVGAFLEKRPLVKIENILFFTKQGYKIGIENEGRINERN